MKLWNDIKWLLFYVVLTLLVIGTGIGGVVQAVTGSWEWNIPGLTLVLVCLIEYKAFIEVIGKEWKIFLRERGLKR